MTQEEVIAYLTYTDYLFKEYLNIRLDKYHDQVSLISRVCMPLYSIKFVIRSEDFDTQLLDKKHLDNLISEMVAIFIYTLSAKPSYIAGENLQPNFTNKPGINT